MEFCGINDFCEIYNFYVKESEQLKVEKALERLTVYADAVQLNDGFSIRLKKDQLNPMVNKLAVFYFWVFEEDGKSVLQYKGHDY
ncbi:hypothetical protein [Listeria costaricensis]|uniref:hypothetical protein n=1 Tax=Listeria costaricensis TaxID=2026604 RepID=UPI000C075D0E|nr:hypothetical protein [Listeria costaricensis]